MTDAELLQRIQQLLTGGLQTNWHSRAYSSDEVGAVIAGLQRLSLDDLQGRLLKAGFTLQPYVAAEDPDAIEQSCTTCMYFERNHGLCDLPELLLPVKPEWSCILWRI